MYHYAGNNPVRYIDPDGEFPVAVVGAAFVWGMNLALLSYGVHHSYAVDKGNELYRNIAEGNHIECSSMDLYCLYKSRVATEVTLRQIGMLDVIKEAVQSGTNNTESGEPIQTRVIMQLKDGKGYQFERSYNFIREKFAIGRATVSGRFEGTVTKNKNGSVHIDGTITYSFLDIFTDPYDTFNLTKNSEWNPDGKPFSITDTWKVYINGDY